jgi:ATP-dependent DNA helicase RecG
VEDPVSLLPGAGPATSARLAARGLRTVADLLGLLPRGYDDLRVVTPLGALASIEEGRVVVVRGTVGRIRVFPGRFLDVVVEGEGAEIHARWFRVPGGMAKQFVRGAAVALAGPLRVATSGERELVHPANVTALLATPAAGAAGAVLAAPAGLGIRARYPQVEGVSGRVLEKIISAAVDRYADRAVECLPPGTRARLDLPPLGVALRAIHQPSPSSPPGELDALLAARSPAHRRLALEDLLIIQLGFSVRRQRARIQPARPCDADVGLTMERVRGALRGSGPFVLTEAQERAIAEIARDMAQPRPMQRLLVGDVGSGKTAVAFAAASLAAASGGQTLLMAPTEILAEQHVRTLSALARPLGMRVALLTAGTPRPIRESTLALGRQGQVHILVGTQSLLDKRIALPDVRLAIIDEQHRFGVTQRARLRRTDEGREDELPHLLVMTATPIPRTLALTLYGDLDASVLDQLPPGRAPTVTGLCAGEEGRALAEQQLRATVEQGHQAFVVCPVRAVSTRAGAVTAVDRYAALERSLAPARVGLVHGEQGSGQKDAVLRGFAAGELDVLVATTVVELGIDVPNATLMVVEEADRFGLAQLHQLRGRVGRGGFPGQCLLWVAGDREIGEEARERLRLLVSTNDGFRVAEADLTMRGHGDLFGLRQAGVPRLRFSDLGGYLSLLEEARHEAERIVAADPTLSLAEHQPLRSAMETRWAEGQVFGEEAG